MWKFEALKRAFVLRVLMYSSFGKYNETIIMYEHIYLHIRQQVVLCFIRFVWKVIEQKMITLNLNM